MPELDFAIALAQRAAQLANQIYARAFTVRDKGHDDPVTEADVAIDQLITTALRAQYPHDSVISEESPDSARGPRCWFIDPIDGTKEFVSKTGDFVVMIGLCDGPQPTLGVVAHPPSGRVFCGGPQLGASMLKNEMEWPLQVHTEQRPLHLAVSRSHRSRTLQRAIDATQPAEVKRVGSVGLKLALIASGQVDGYFELSGNTKTWDTCAPAAILAGAGGLVTDVRGAPLTYLGRENNAAGVLAATPLWHAKLRQQLTVLGLTFGDRLGP